MTAKVAKLERMSPVPPVKAAESRFRWDLSVRAWCNRSNLFVQLVTVKVRKSDKLSHDWVEDEMLFSFLSQAKWSTSATVASPAKAKKSRQRRKFWRFTSIKEWKTARRFCFAARVTNRYWQPLDPLIDRWKWMKSILSIIYSLEWKLVT